MKGFVYFGIKLEHLCSPSPSNFCRSLHRVTMSSYRVLAFYVSPFYIKLCYLVILSQFGFLGLKFSKPRTHVMPSNLDLFYTSVSASTVSSMTAVEMEVFSNSQLILLTFLMFLGGEVLTSMLGLLFARFNFTQKQTVRNGVNTPALKQGPHSASQVELGLTTLSESTNQKQNKDSNVENGLVDDRSYLKYNSIRYLGYVVLGYLMVAHLVGSGFVSLYVSLTPSAREVLNQKGLKLQTFSVFTIVSTFASCGFIPTNENMIIFKRNSGLLLLIIPHIFLGNTLYPPCLRLVIWVLQKFTKREEFSYLLRNYKEIGFDHMLSVVHCWLLVATVLGFNLIQFVLFISLEWNSENMKDLSLYQKLIASLFQITNSRHTGESVFDLSTISAAILVLFIVMMYLPPYTTFLPIREDDRIKEKRSIVDCLPLSYLVISIILICITERSSLKNDPLNFNVLNITLEVISAYGNVGFSMGYSCKRQLKADGLCRDSWVAFSGRWSNKGKFILVLVMFFGRLKKFNMRGGKAWHLS